MVINVFLASTNGIFLLNLNQINTGEFPKTQSKIVRVFIKETSIDIYCSVHLLIKVDCCTCDRNQEERKTEQIN